MFQRTIDRMLRLAIGATACAEVWQDPGHLAASCQLDAAGEGREPRWFRRQASLVATYAAVCHLEVQALSVVIASASIPFSALSTSSFLAAWQDKFQLPHRTIPEYNGSFACVLKERSLQQGMVLVKCDSLRDLT
jgi:hypothetical protein